MYYCINSLKFETNYLASRIILHIHLDRLINALPPCHRNLATYIFCILFHISLLAEDNQMIPKNLGVCVGQSIIWSRENLNPTFTVVKVSQVVEYLITNFPQIFGRDALHIFDEQQNSSASISLNESNTINLLTCEDEKSINRMEIPKLAGASININFPEEFSDCLELPSLTGERKASSVDSDNCSSTGSTCKCKMLCSNSVLVCNISQ